MGIKIKLEKFSNDVLQETEQRETNTFYCVYQWRQDTNPGCWVLGLCMGGGGGGGVIVLYPGGRQNDIRTPAVVIKTMAKKTILFVSGTRGGVKVGPYKIH